MDDVKLVQHIARSLKDAGNRKDAERLFTLARTLQSLLDRPIDEAQRILFDLRVAAHKQDVEQQFGPER